MNSLFHHWDVEAGRPVYVIGQRFVVVTPAGGIVDAPDGSHEAMWRLANTRAYPVFQHTKTKT
jgi:hypothetical protein